MKKKASVAERKHLQDVASLGCVICKSPCQVHHLRTGMGMGQRNSHYMTIGLCHYHHMGAEGIHHLGKRAWEAKYGTELELLEKVREELGEMG
jgi:hypothetical protein